MNATKMPMPIRELQKSLDRSFRRTDLQLRKAGLLVDEQRGQQKTDPKDAKKQ